MFRKSLITLATVATVTVAALAPASAKPFKHGHWKWGVGTVILIGGILAAESCYRYRWVENRWGELVYRPVNVCRW